MTDQPEAGPSSEVLISLEDVVEHTKSLPSSPEIMPKIQAIIRNPNANITDIADLIKQDAGLTSHVIRMAKISYTSSQHFSNGCLNYRIFL